MPDVLHFSLPGKPEYVGTVRMAISCLANAVGFDVEAVEDIKVAVSEACTNVVCHCGYPSRLYEVICEVEDGRIIVSVVDQGDGYDPDQYCQPCLDVPKEGGLGLFVIRALMDEVDIFSETGGGTQIKMIKYVR